MAAVDATGAVCEDDGYATGAGGSSSSQRRDYFGYDEAETHLSGLLLWLRDESFIATIAEWSWDACTEFPRERVEPGSIEHSLRFTEAHQEYRQLFERRAEEYLQFYGLGTENFLQLSIAYLEGRPASVGAEEDILEGLIASESYFAFFMYMCSVRRRREWAERTMCSSLDEIDWSELMRRALRRDLGDMTVGDESDVEFLD